MAGCEKFIVQNDVNAYQAHKLRLAGEHSDWSEAEVSRQALIDFNTIMFPNQVKTYFNEKRGEKIGHVDQAYEPRDNDLFDPYFGPFQSMIDHEPTLMGKRVLEEFRTKALAALPGEKISVLDTSGLGEDKGIKYFDTYEKGEDGKIKHKERIDLTGDSPDLTLEQAEEKLTEMKSPNNSEMLDFLPTVPMVGSGQSNIIPTSTFELPMNRFIGSNEIQELTELSPVFTVVGFWFEAMAAAEKKSEKTSIPSLKYDRLASQPAYQSEWIGQKESVANTPELNEKEIPAELPINRSIVNDQIKLAGKVNAEPFQPITTEVEKTKVVLVEPKSAKPTRTVPVGRKTPILSGGTSGTVLKGNSQVLFTAKKETEEVAVREKPPVQTKTAVIKNNNRPTAVSKLLMKSEQQIKADNPAVEIPKYCLPQWSFQQVFLNEKEMPIWQMYFIGQSKDLTMVVLAIFWLILNTKPLHITAGRGSGLGFYLRDLMFLEAEKN